VKSKHLDKTNTKTQNEEVITPDFILSILTTDKGEWKKNGQKEEEEFCLL
jgi:hypothetical protein